MKYYMAKKYNQIETVFLLDTCNLLMVLWCSGYHVCFTRRRSRVRTSPEPPLFRFKSDDVAPPKAVDFVDFVSD